MDIRTIHVDKDGKVAFICFNANERADIRDFIMHDGNRLFVYEDNKPSYTSLRVNDDWETKELA